MGIMMKLFGAIAFAMQMGYSVANSPLGLCGAVRWILDTATTSLATSARAFRGYYYAAPPDKPLARAPGFTPIVLYEYEGCPFCRKVREVVSALALPVRVYPTPRVTLKEYSVIEGSRYRGEVVKLGGKAMFPYMVDANTSTSMYESGDIIAYLLKTYGPAHEDLPAVFQKPEAGLSLGMMVAAAARPLGYMGMLRTPSRLPGQPLTFYGTEGHAGSRLVREALTSLELPHEWIPVPAGSPERARFDRAFSARTLPILVDTNESSMPIAGGAACVRYLLRAYKTGDTVKETFGDYSTKGASKDHGTLTAKESKKED